MHRTVKGLLLILALLASGMAGAAEPVREVTLYKTPYCGCCEGYAEYLRENGFRVTVEPTHELPVLSREAGIPEDFQGCHLSMIGRYAVSGHVPVEAIHRLLDEQPAIEGITLPGMPMGSPGMSGSKQAPFTVYAIESGEPRVFSVE